MNRRRRPEGGIRPCFSGTGPRRRDLNPLGTRVAVPCRAGLSLSMSSSGPKTASTASRRRSAVCRLIENAASRSPRVDPPRVPWRRTTKSGISFRCSERIVVDLWITFGSGVVLHIDSWSISECDAFDAFDDIEMSIVAQHPEGMLPGQRGDPSVVGRNRIA